MFPDYSNPPPLPKEGPPAPIKPAESLPSTPKEAEKKTAQPALPSPVPIQPADITAAKLLKERDVKAADISQGDGKLSEAQTTTSTLGMQTLANTAELQKQVAQLLESAKEKIQKGDAASAKAALIDLAKAESLQPFVQIFYLKGTALHLLKDFPGAYEALLDAEQIGMFAEDSDLLSTEPAFAKEHRFKEFNQLKIKNPEFAKLWKEATLEWRVQAYQIFDRLFSQGIEPIFMSSLSWFGSLSPSLGPQAAMEALKFIEQIYISVVDKVESIDPVGSIDPRAPDIVTRSIIDATIALKQWRPKFWEKLTQDVSSKQVNYLEQISLTLKGMTGDQAELAKQFIGYVERDDRYNETLKDACLGQATQNVSVLRLLLALKDVSTAQPPLALYFAKILEVSKPPQSGQKWDATELIGLPSFVERNGAALCAEFYSQYLVDKRDGQGNFKSSADQEYVNKVQERIRHPNFIYLKITAEFPNADISKGILPKDLQKIEMYRTLHFLRNDSDVARKLFSMKDLSLRGRLLQLVASGNLPLVQELMELEDKVSRQKAAKTDTKTLEAFAKRLSAQVNVQTAPIIKALLELPDNHSLRALAAAEAPDKPFDKEFCSLLALALEGGDEELLKSARSSPLALRCITERRFALARACLDHSEAAFWKKITSLPNLSIERVQQLSDLHKSLKLAPPKILTPANIAAIENFAFNIATQPAKDSAPIDNWFALIQCELVHNPDSITNMLKSPDWAAMEKSVNDNSAFKIDLNSPLVMRAEAMKSIQEAITDTIDPSLDTTKMTIVIASLLLNLDGTINTALIPAVLAALHSEQFEKFETLGEGRAFIAHVLHAIQKDPAFSDILKNLKVTDPDLRSNQLMRKIRPHILPAFKAAIPRDAQIAALSALLWPLRQSGAGSCFATSIAIQQSSTTNGLKQSLKDFAELLSTDGIAVRDPSLPFQKIKHPMSFDLQGYGALFTRDHFLARAREFTLASINQREVEVTDTTDKWSQLFETQFAGYKKTLGTNQQKIIKGMPILDLDPLLFRSMSGRYLGYAREQSSGKLGAWVLVNRKNEQPLVESLEAFQNFFLDIFEQMYQHEKTCKRDVLQLDILRQFIDKVLVPYVKSDKFLADSLGVEKAQIHTYFGFDATYLKAGDLVVFTGSGETNSFRAGRIVESVKLDPSGHPLESILSYVQGLPAAERSKAEQNPSLLKTFDTTSHRLNMKLGALVKAMPAGKDPKQIVDDLKAKNREFFQTPLPAAYQKQLKAIEESEKKAGPKAAESAEKNQTDEKATKEKLNASFAEAEKGQKAILDTFISHCTSSGSKKETELRSKLQKAIEDKPPNNLFELSDLLIKNSGIDEGRAKSILALAFSSLDFTKGRMPPIYHVADTNWDSASNLSYGLDFSPAGDCSTPIYTSQSGMPVVTSLSNTMWPIDSWIIYEFADPFAEIPKG